MTFKPATSSAPGFATDTYSHWALWLVATALYGRSPAGT